MQGHSALNFSPQHNDIRDRVYANVDILARDQRSSWLLSLVSEVSPSVVAAAGCLTCPATTAYR